MSEATVSRETCFKFPWLPRDVRALKRLHSRKMPTDEIAQILGRSPLSVRLKISRLHIGRKYRKSQSPTQSRG